MPDADPRYRLVIFDAIEDPQELRDFLSGATGSHPTDVVQWLARAPGLWPQPLQSAVIRKVLDGLYDHGVAAEAWRADQFPDLGLPRTTHRAACLDQGLRIEGLRGEPTHWVPWDLVEMICAGRIGGSDEFRDVEKPRWHSAMAAGLRALTLKGPRSFDRKARAQRIVRDPIGEILVVRRDPRITFRFVESRMNYAYLGNRLMTAAADNFPILLADLCARADSAYLTTSTRSLLKGGPPEDYEFPSSTALLEYATHRLLWSWYRRDGRSQAGPRPGETAGSSERPIIDDQDTPP